MRSFICVGDIHVTIEDYAYFIIVDDVFKEKKHIGTHK